MRDLNIASLRHFVVVADELHFTRAAARLHIAQQALSRSIARLERDLSVPLFERSTRRVSLTADAERLVPRARELLAGHDEFVASTRAATRPLVVDVVAAGSTPARVVALARTLDPEARIEMHYHGGLGAALESLRAARVDVAFGRSTSERLAMPAGVTQRLVRLEPLGLLVLDDDPWAGSATVSHLAGRTIDTSGGNTAAPE